MEGSGFSVTFVAPLGDGIDTTWEKIATIDPPFITGVGEVFSGAETPTVEPPCGTLSGVSDSPSIAAIVLSISLSVLN